jgi:hypothetical protein
MRQFRERQELLLEPTIEMGGEPQQIYRRQRTVAQRQQRLSQSLAVRRLRASNPDSSWINHDCLLSRYLPGEGNHATMHASELCRSCQIQITTLSTCCNSKSA